MTALEINFVKLAECLVSPGWRLKIAATNAPAIHYNLKGMGRMIVGRNSPIALAPHTLAIVPPNMPFFTVMLGPLNPDGLTLPQTHCASSSQAMLRPKSSLFVGISAHPTVPLSIYLQPYPHRSWKRSTPPTNLIAS